MMCSAEQRVQARNKEKVWNSRKKGSNTGTLGKKCQDGRCTVVLWWSPCWFSVTKSCLTLCDSMDYSTPGFPVLHFLPEFAQTHVHWVGDVFQPSNPLLPSSPHIFIVSIDDHNNIFYTTYFSNDLTLTFLPSALSFGSSGLYVSGNSIVEVTL